RCGDESARRSRLHDRPERESVHPRNAGRARAPEAGHPDRGLPRSPDDRGRVIPAREPGWTGAAKRDDMSGVLVVTGGSRGIGAAVCQLGAERGYAVCVNYVGQAARAAEGVQGIQSKGGTAIAVQGDVSREDDVERLFQTVDRELGRVTALVNNAGVGPGLGRLEEIDPRDIRRTLEVNVIGVHLCAAGAIRRMARRHGGTGGAIVNVSSAAARIGSPGAFVHYAASKGAVDVLTIGLGKEAM